MSGAQPKRLRQSIFWLNKPEHFEKLPAWLAARKEFDTILRVTHDDTGAVSFWLFLEKERRGIVRCLTPDLADAAEDQRRALKEGGGLRNFFDKFEFDRVEIGAFQLQQRHRKQAALQLKAFWTIHSGRTLGGFAHWRR